MKGRTRLLVRRNSSSLMDQLIQQWLGHSQAPPELGLVELLRQRPKSRCCPRCGQGVGSGELTETGCGGCRGKGPILDGVIRVGAYRGVLAELICSLKYSGRWELAPGLGRLLAHRVRAGVGRMKLPALVESDWVVIPMPMPGWRRWHRGLDHARLIAESLAEQLGLPVIQPLRKRPGPPQASLSRTRRLRSPLDDYCLVRKGIKGFGGLLPNLSGLGVILVDDVLTTGRSMRAAGTILERLGPARILAVALAVTDHREYRSFCE